jgi:AcrR family transcriptional regulator
MSIGGNLEEGIESPGTRAAILASAERRIRNQGFHAARLTDITADIGLTTGAFYRQFASKEALFEAMFEEMAQELDRALGGSHDLAGATVVWLEVSRQHPGTVRAQRELLGPGTPFAGLWARARERWETSLQGLIPGRSARHRMFATLIVDTLEYSAFAREIKWWPTTTDAAFAETLSRIVTSGMYPPREASADESIGGFVPVDYRTSLIWEPAQGKVVPTSSRGRRTVESLRQAAHDVFASEGVHQATMLDIASAAGMASGTAYRYFVDKEDLLRSLLARAEQDLVQSTFHTLDAGRHPVAPVYRTFLSLHRQKVGVFRAWWESMEPDSDFEAAWVRMHNLLMSQLVKVLRHGQRLGLVATDLDLETTAQIYSGLHERSAYTRVAMGRDLGWSDAEVAEALDAMCNGGTHWWSN